MQSGGVIRRVFGGCPGYGRTDLLVGPETFRFTRLARPIDPAGLAGASAPQPAGAAWAGCSVPGDQALPVEHPGHQRHGPRIDEQQYARKKEGDPDARMDHA